MTVIQIVRKLLTPDEVSNPNQRYNADCDCVQTSYDGGTTWTDTPNADPRHYDGFRLAPVSGMDPQCLAAGNMTDKLKFILDTIITSATIFGAATAVVNVILVFAPAEGILLDLILAVCEALFDAGLAAVNAALTSGVYDQLACILYCSIGGDGQVSAEQYAIIRSRIDDQIGGLAAIAIDYALDQLGEVGLSNAGTIGESTRDCSGCGCQWCYEFDFTLSDGGWTEFTDGVPGATYVLGVGWVDKTTGGTRGTFIQSPVVDLTTFTEIQFDYTAVSNVTSTVDYGQNGASFPMVDVCPGALGSFTVTWDGSVDFDRVGLQVGNSTGFAAGSSVISRARYKGTGTNPFGDDNC